MRFGGPTVALPHTVCVLYCLHMHACFWLWPFRPVSIFLDNHLSRTWKYHHISVGSHEGKGERARKWERRKMDRTVSNDWGRRCEGKKVICRSTQLSDIVPKVTFTSAFSSFLPSLCLLVHMLKIERQCTYSVYTDKRIIGCGVCVHVSELWVVCVCALGFWSVCQSCGLCSYVWVRMCQLHGPRVVHTPCCVLLMSDGESSPGPWPH